MKETEQTLLDQIIDDVAKENGGYKYHRSILNDEFWRIVCEHYAEAKAKASCEATLKKASENAVVRGYCAGCERVGLLHCAHADSCESNVVIVDKSSITDPSNIVIV